MPKILLIEDDANVSDLYDEVLTEGGYEVEIVDDGEEAKTRAIAGGWDLMLLDIMLPKLDGMELLRAIKNDRNVITKPIIILSALEKKEIIEECLKLGAKQYLVKSNIYPNDLLNAVSRYFPKD